MAHYFLRLTRHNKVVWLTVDQLYQDTEAVPVLDIVEWPTENPWNSLQIKLEERPWIPSSIVFELVNEARQIFQYLSRHSLASVNKVDQLREAFPNSKFCGNWIFNKNEETEFKDKNAFIK
jgi:hypothetical protein